MKKFLILLSLTLSLSNAQTQHGNTLTWTPASNQTGQTFNVYSVLGTCIAATPLSAWKQIATGLTVSTYFDSTVTFGASVCYQVTDVYLTVESAPSNQSQVPAGPTGLSVVVK